MRGPRSIPLLAWLGLLVASMSCAPAQAAAAPGAVPAGEEVTAMVAGADHTCALFGGRTMRCWGGNRHGELGDGTTVSSARPVEVKGPVAAPTTTLSRGGHTCSLLGDGTVRCWGSNGYGQLGDGTRADSTRPVPVRGLTGKVRLLAVGDDRTCVAYESGATWCWGRDGSGGPSGPAEVRGLPSPPAQLVAGAAHTCAVLRDGSTWCWGRDGGGGPSSGAPVEVKGLPSAPVRLTAGDSHTCALVKDGSAWCWGEGRHGQLGTGSTKPSPVPRRVVGLQRGPTQLAAGGDHTCAVFGDSTLWCWGRNDFGQLGDGTTADASRPVRVRNVRLDPALLVGGGGHTCLAYRDSSIDCWGLNTAGQLGDGTVKPLNRTPGSVVGLAAAPAHHGVHQHEAAAAATSDPDDGILAGRAAEIGLLILTAAVFAAFLATRRRPN
ncbi:RCC1 domain-containing protein [Actinomadura litoris]|uniref:RCC1 domain-containing protein n=1 Tax=Actinomadura litoris TaxID=2678616 RepID=UPI00156658F1|nr:RCC1 domain-containing protein [Actinomadura litoris]